MFPNDMWKTDFILSAGGARMKENTQNPRLRSPKPRDRHGISFSQWNFAKNKKQ